MRPIPSFMLLVASLTIVACGNLTNPHFHTVALDPTQHPLSHPGYLIGIEKAKAKLVGSVPFETCQPDPTAFCLNRDAGYLKDKEQWLKKLEQRLDDPKRLFVTHIATYKRGNGQGHTLPLKASLLANLYRNGSLTCAKGDHHHKPTCIPKGVEALKTLEADLEKRIAREHPTHILFYSTGWNSDQIDSIRRYNLFFDQIVKAVQEAGDDSFRPLFIGITWPADWTKLPGYSDILNKKNDADEAGVTWVNYIVNKILLPFKKEGVKIVLIGHSFGGRIVTTAANSRDLLPDPSVGKINLVVGLQAAFSIKRFGGGTEGDPFKNFSTYADKFVFVSSKNDAAGRVLKNEVNAILGVEGIDEAQKGELAKLFQVITVNDSGEWESEPSLGPEKVLLLDASAIVKDHDDVKAHNDVNNKEVGHLLWRTITTYAP